MSRRYARSLAAFPAAVLAAVLGVTTAFAATTWTVRTGGSISMSSKALTLKDTKTGAMFTCTSSVLSGTLRHGGGLPGSGIGSITAASITECGEAGFVFPVKATDLPWHVNFSSYNATKGVVTGSVSHVQIHVRAVEFRCTAVVDGTSGTASDGIVRFSYANATALLRTVPGGGDMHFYKVSGCAGLYRTGDPATLSGAFTVSPKQTVTSP
jgi:hypothetical protein